MASISTCFTLKPSRQYPISLRPHYDIFLKQFLTLPKQHCINNSRTSAPGIRAGSNVPPKIIKTDKLPTEVMKRVMNAVDICGRRVTVGDVASKAGIKLTDAQKALHAIAADTNAILEVSEEGDIIYVFPKDYRSKLASKSRWMKTEPRDKAKLVAEHLVKVAFGTTLIASTLIVFTTIIVILTK